MDNTEKITTAFLNSIGLIYEWGLILLHGMTHRFDNQSAAGISAGRMQRMQLEAVEVCMRMSIDYSDFGDVLLSDI